MDSHCRDKTVLWQSYLDNEISCTEKKVYNIETARDIDSKFSQTLL